MIYPLVRVGKGCQYSYNPPPPPNQEKKPMLKYINLSTDIRTAYKPKHKSTATDGGLII